MSDRPRLRLFDLARMGVIATSIVGSVALGSGSLIAVAQEASPSPMGECVPGEMSMGTAEASPSADMASPEATEAPTGSPADEATTAAATAAIENIIACASDPASLATLVTVNLVATHPFGGYGSIEEAVADGFFEEFPYAAGVEIGDVTSYDDGSVGVDVQYMQSQYQVVAEELILIDEGGTWKLNAVGPARVDVDGDTAAVGVAVGENEDGTYFITPNASAVAATDVLILQGTNNGQEPHEIVMVQLPEGADPMGLLDGSISEEDVNFIGFIYMPTTGSMAEMTLVDLPPGQYTLVCFIPGPDGAPHAAHGMIAPFEVTAPEATPEA